MKTLFRLFVVLGFILSIPSLCTFSQVAINTDNSAPDGSAMLDIKSTDKGILIPRLTLVQRNAILSPPIGLLIYQIDNIPGFYYYTGSAWTILSTISGDAYWTRSNDTISPKNYGDIVKMQRLLINVVDSTPIIRFYSSTYPNIESHIIVEGNGPAYGGYQGGNIGIGAEAFGRNYVTSNSSYTHGGNNIAIGNMALYGGTSGNDNYAFGIGALYFHPTSRNIAMGNQALFYDSTGEGNMAFGYRALHQNGSGNENFAAGYLSQYSGTNAGYNISIGNQTLYNTTTGSNNIALGGESLFSNVAGDNNIGLGINTL